MHAKRIVVWLTVAVVLTLSGCSPDSPPTGPTRVSGSEFYAALSPAEKAAQDAAKDSAKAAHQRLLAARDSIRALQNQRKKDSKALLDSLKRDWNAYKREWAAYKKDNKNAVVELLRCAPLGYLSDAEVIGPAGGELHIGPHALVIPKGALSQEQLIVGESPLSSLVDVDFWPQGLHFVQSAQLTLSYEHCMRPDNYTYRIAYVSSDKKQVLEFPPSKDDKTLKAVTAAIDHFSSYIIAY